MNPVFGKYIMVIGASLLLIGGIIFFFGDKLHWLGRLPGDIRITGKDGGRFYFPIVTCIVISVLLNLLIGLIRRFF
jgi:Protein of unknown function (DUF2905)